MTQQAIIVHLKTHDYGEPPYLYHVTWDEVGISALVAAFSFDEAVRKASGEFPDAPPHNLGARLIENVNGYKVMLRKENSR